VRVNGLRGASGNLVASAEAQLNIPAGMRRRPDGSLYHADSMNGLVRKVGL